MFLFWPDYQTLCWLAAVVVLALAVAAVTLGEVLRVRSVRGRRPGRERLRRRGPWSWRVAA